MILINNCTVMFPLLLMHIQLLPTMSSYMCALLEFFIFNGYQMRKFCLSSDYPIVTKREQSCAAIYMISRTYYNHMFPTSGAITCFTILQTPQL